METATGGGAACCAGGSGAAFATGAGDAAGFAAVSVFGAAFFELFALRAGVPFSSTAGTLGGWDGAGCAGAEARKTITMGANARAIARGIPAD